MTSKIWLRLIFSAVAFVGASAVANPGQRVEIEKTDGTKDVYQLLPFDIQPGHAADVQARLALSVRSAATPRSHDISANLYPPVRDQGARGTCSYFAVGDAIEASYIRKTPSLQSSLEISRECLVDLRNWEFDQGDAYTGADKPAQRPDPNGDMPLSLIETVSAFGVPAARVYNNGIDCTYNGADIQGVDLSLQQYQQALTESPAVYAKNASFITNTQPTIESIKALLAQDIPVVATVVIYTSYIEKGNFIWTYNSGVDTDRTIIGSHAILLTGYHETLFGKTIFNFKSSWGPKWGNHGYGTIDENALTIGWGLASMLDATISL